MPIKGIITPLETAKVQKAIAYIEHNYTENISLDSLIEEVCLDRKVFRRVFRKLTSQTVHEYLLNVRISRAKEALCDFNLTISQVAHRTGFSSGNHFTKVFRKLEGILPTDFRVLIIHCRHDQPAKSG